MTKILAFSGSLWAESFNQKVAVIAAEALREAGAEETFSLAKAHEAFAEDGSLKDDEAASKVKAIGRALAEAS